MNKIPPKHVQPDDAGVENIRRSRDLDIKEGLEALEALKNQQKIIGRRQATVQDLLKLIEAQTALIEALLKRY